MNNLPKNWCECCIKDVANIQTGKLDANAAVENGNYPFFTCALEPLKINTFSFDGNCIYLPGNGANVGYVGYYQGKFDVYQRTYVLDKIAINERYLYFSILLNWKNYNKNKQFGVATNFIRLGNLENYPINLPPLEEQGRIVEKIEELFSDIDNGIKDLKIAQAQIKQYRQSVLKSAFEGKLYKTSEWKEVDIKKIISREKNALKAGPFGSALKKEIYVANGYKIYGQEQVISQNPFLGNYYINEEKYQQLISCSVKPLDILISLVGTIGKVLILPKGIEKGIINPRLIKVTLDVDQYLPAFFKLYFESQYLRSLFKTKAHGATMDVLNLSILKEIPFPLPTIPEQQQIVAEIEKRFAVADEMEKAVNEGLEKTDKLKQSILKKAFEGKLVPQDPNDEPASALLDRIKKEQKPTKGKKK